MPNWQEFLSTIPIFSFLSRSELEALQESFVEVSYHKGDTVCRMGEEGDTFYVVLSGELEVWGGPEGNVRTATLGPRDFFGEMALLQGGKRTATITVSRRARLLALDETSFERLFLKNPKATEYFARVLCKRLANVTRGERVRRATTTIGVTGKPGLKGKSVVASALAQILQQLTGAEVLLVQVQPGSGGREEMVAQLLADDLGDVPDKIRRVLLADTTQPAVLSIQAAPDKPKEVYEERASNLVAKLSPLFSFMVFDLGSEIPSLIESAGRFSDVLIQIVDEPGPAPPPQPETATQRFEVINLFNPGCKGIAISHCEPFVIPSDPILSGQESPDRYLRENGRSPAGLPLHRLARKLLGATVGLALGGGAAFGISHLGVLRVLEANRVPIDLVAGCSQGSIIAVGYAGGIATQEMVAIALRLGRKRNFFTAMDLTFTMPGFLAGNRMIEIFAPLLEGKTTFEDLLLPCTTIATDIESGERVVIGSGRLDLAFRASSSVPMVFAPLKVGDRALVDGGVSDPVPAEVVRSMGADLCIAVNVVPPLKKGIQTVLSRTYQVVNRFNPLSYLGNRQNLPNMFDIVMNSMQTLQYELGNFKAISADVLINPDLSDFTWIEYYRSEELIERGARAAEQALPAIQKAIDEKLAAVRKQTAEQPIAVKVDA